jgi:hypothetical protein
MNIQYYYSSFRESACEELAALDGLPQEVRNHDLSGQVE